MPVASFRIIITLASGGDLEAFTWTRDAASGIARAWREAAEFGFKITAVRAEPI